MAAAAVAASNLGTYVKKKFFGSLFVGVIAIAI